MSGRTISVEKEAEISAEVEKEIETIKDGELRDIELKIGEIVSKKMNGEPWICHVEKQPNSLEWHEKPQLYNLDIKRIEAMKKLREEQAEGYEKMLVATPKFKIFLVKAKLQVTFLFISLNL